MMTFLESITPIDTQICNAKDIDVVMPCTFL